MFTWWYENGFRSQQGGFNLAKEHGVWMYYSEVGRVLEKMVDIAALKPMDRLAGLAFALGRAWLFWSIVVLLIQGTLGQDMLPADWIAESWLWPALDETARFVLPIIDPWIPEI